MIDKEQLMKKLGKQGFKDFVANNRSDQPTGFDKTRGIRGRIKFRRCEHGVYVIDNYVVKGCQACSGLQSKSTKLKDFKPYFNIGLGAYVESRSEEKKLAKQKQYVEAG